MKRFFRLLIFGSFVLAIAAIILFAVCEREPGKSEQIADLMARYDELGQFNGSILVAENCKVIYKAGIGHADLEWRIPKHPRYQVPHRIHHQAVHLHAGDAIGRRGENRPGGYH